MISIWHFNYSSRPFQFSSVQSLSCVRLFAAPWTSAWQTSPNLRGHQNLRPLCWWCHRTISLSVVPYSSCLQSFPASGSFQMSQLFTSHGWNWSFSFNISPSNKHPGLISFGMFGCISLQSKGLSRICLNNRIQKHQSSALSFLYSPTLTSIHNPWKNCSLE